MGHAYDGSGEEIKRAAYGVLAVLRDNLPSGASFYFQQEDEIVISALQRHGVHLSTHGVDQKHLDPFKLACWIGCEIIERIEDVSFHQHEVVIDAVIKTLEEFLAMETQCSVRVPENDKALIKRTLIEEMRGNGDHGIGFNGLFVAFHCYRSAHGQVVSVWKN